MWFEVGGRYVRASSFHSRVTTDIHFKKSLSLPVVILKINSTQSEYIFGVSSRCTNGRMTMSPIVHNHFTISPKVCIFSDQLDLDGRCNARVVALDWADSSRTRASSSRARATRGQNRTKRQKLKPLGKKQMQWVVLGRPASSTFLCHG